MLAQLLVAGVERLGHAAGGADHRHEVVVAAPARHQMQMQMILDRGAGVPAEIGAHVEGMWIDRPAQRRLGANQQGK